MSSDRDVTRAVRAWLEEGATVFPDRLLDEVLDQLPATPQRRGRWSGRWFPAVTRTVGVATAAAALVAAAVLGIGVLRSQNVGAPALPPASAIASPTPTPLPLLGQRSLTAGTYLVNVPQPLRVTVTVPEGWRAVDDWAVVGPQGENPPAGMAIGFWGVQNLYADPSQPELGLLQPRVGPTVDDLASTLLNQPGWASASGPIDVTVDGYAGQQVELTAPSDADFGQGQFRIWLATNGGDRYLQGPGQIERVVILDVDGERLVIDVHYFPDTPAEDRAALEQVFDSIRIEPEQSAERPAATPAPFAP